MGARVHLRHRVCARAHRPASEAPGLGDHRAAVLVMEDELKGAAVSTVGHIYSSLVPTAQSAPRCQPPHPD
jgi:hypothetical protein